MSSFDVVIIGGGPAGISTAISLYHAGFSLTVLEKGDYESNRLGECVPPTIRHVLSKLGLWKFFLETSPLPSFGYQSSWAGFNYLDHIYNPWGNGWLLDRKQFNKMLARTAVEFGIDLQMNATVRKLDHKKTGGWVVNYTKENEHKINCNFLVNATGRNSSFSKRMFCNVDKLDRLIGVASIVQCNQNKTGNFVFVESIKDGWWYSAPTPNNQIVMTLMTDYDLVPFSKSSRKSMWLERLKQSQYTAKRYGNSTASPLLIEPAHSSCSTVHAGKDFIMVGDASIASDPLSSQGIYHALLSGIKSTEVIKKVFNNDVSEITKYQLSCQKRWNLYLDKRIEYYSLETRWRNELFWKRRKYKNLCDMPIQINPDVVLSKVNFKNESKLRNKINQLETQFKFKEFKRLLSETSINRTAESILASYAPPHCETVNYREVISALQVMLDEGLIKSKN